MIPNKFHQGELTVIFFSGDFYNLQAWHQNLKRMSQLFQVSIHVHPGLQSVAFEDRKQFQCLYNIVLKRHNSTIIFGIRLWRRNVLAFEKDSK